MVISMTEEWFVSCDECTHRTVHRGKMGCTYLYPMRMRPEDMYYDDKGDVIGCRYGEKK
jgi:hypothetical protein